MLDRIKYAAFALGGIVAAACVVLLYATLIMVPSAKREGRDTAIATQAVKDVKTELERKGDDATLQTKSDYDLCVIGLAGNGMQIDACEQLRGISEE